MRGHLIGSMKKLIALIIICSIAGYFSVGKIFPKKLNKEFSLEGVSIVESKGAAYSGTYNLTKKTAEFTTYTSWINYKTPDGWAPIDTSLRQTPTGFVMDKAPFEFTAPLRSTGTAIFYNNNLWHEKTKSRITASPLDLNITALGINDVTGELRVGNLGFGSSVEYIVYPDAYNVSFINGYFRPSFNLHYSEPVDFYRKVDNKRTKWLQGSVMGTQGRVEIRAASTSQARGIGMDKFSIWDMSERNQKRQLVQADFAPMGNNDYVMTKLIPQTFFSTSTPNKADLIYYIGKAPAPNLKKLICFKDSLGGYIACTDAEQQIYPEDSDHGTLVDGIVACDTGIAGSCNTDTWSSARDATTGDDVNDTAANQVFMDAYSEATPRFNVAYGFMLFSTGDFVGTDDNIDKAVINLWITGSGNTPNDGDDFIVVTHTNPASNTALAGADMDAVTDMAGTNPHGAGVELRDASDYATSSSHFDITNVNVNAWLEIPLNATGTTAIGKGAGSISKFGFAEGHTAYNHAISGNNDNYLRGDTGDGTNRPYLLLKTSSGTPAAVEQEDISNIIPWSEI